MPSPDVHGAHYVLRQSNPGRTHRLSEVIEEAHADEVTVRRGIDALALAGQVKRLYIGEHVMVKKTDEFNSEYAPDVEAATDPGSGSAGLTRGLSPVDYERPVRGVLDPSEYVPPEPPMLDPRDDYRLPDGDAGLTRAEVPDTGDADD